MLLGALPLGPRKGACSLDPPLRLWRRYKRPRWGAVDDHLYHTQLDAQRGIGPVSLASEAWGQGVETLCGANLQVFGGRAPTLLGKVLGF